MPVSINGSNTPTAGGAVYGDGTAYATTAAGTAGQVLTSAGASAPTWATPAVPGATTQYSLVGRNGLYGVATVPATNLADTRVTANLGAYGFAAGNFRDMQAPFWSSFYGKWFCLLQNGATPFWGLYSSSDGLNWYQMSENMTSIVGASGNGYVLPMSGSYNSLLAVDDSNGRFFYLYNDAGVIKVAYSNIGAVALIAATTTWTVVTLLAAGTAVGAAAYCKMATNAASGVVVNYTNSATGTSYVSVCPAGSTTFTQQTSATGASGNITALWYEENGKVLMPFAGGTGRVFYNISGNVNSGWGTAGGLTAPSPERRAFVANGYMVYMDSGGTIYYSTNGTTWASQNIISNALLGMMYTGSRFVTWSINTTWISSSNTFPATWSILSDGTNGTKTLSSFAAPIAQRVTAT